MPQLNQVAARILNQNLMLEPTYAETFIASISDRLNVVQLTTSEGKVIEGNGFTDLAESYAEANAPKKYKPYQVVNNIAILPISGTLVHKHGYLKPYSGMTGYDGIMARIQVAIQDNDVDGIFLDMNTPGGEVAGCFDCSDYINEMQKEKPIWAFCNEMNASAGQAIASACSYRLITQTAIAGSIGVIRAHVSNEKLLERKGVKVTLITAGKHKPDGNPYEDLPADVLARFEEGTADLREMFASKVASYQGLTIEQVKATEALTYTGQKAIDVGLADELVRVDQALDIFSQHLASRQNSNQMVIGANMPREEDSAVVEVDTAKLTADAKTNERARIKGITESEEATGRTALANHFAFNTNMSVEDAVASLAVAPLKVEAADTPNDPLADAMENTNQPNVGADGSHQEDDEEVDLNAVLDIATGAK